MKQSMGGNHACYVHFLETALMIKKNLTLGQGIDKFVKNAFASASERQNIKEKLWFSTAISQYQVTETPA